MKIIYNVVRFSEIDHIGINFDILVGNNNYIIKKTKLLRLDQKYGQKCHYWTEYFKVLVEKKIL